jgi:DNA-binding transcriptional regulator YiaG
MERPKPINYEDLSAEEGSRMELAYNIRRLRAHFNESQQIFATKLGLSIRSLAGYESQGRRPEDKALALFAKVAADEGLHSLANDFLNEIGTSLQLGEIRDGGIVAWDPTKKRGYLLIQLNDEKARDHAQAYYKASRGHFRDAETKAKGQEILSKFTADMAKLPGPSHKGLFKRALAETFQEAKKVKK